MFIIDIDSDSSNEGEIAKKPPSGVARKSTAAASVSVDTRPRRQASLASKEKCSKFLEDAQEFIGNFDPDRSARERRKLSRKINSGSRRPLGALYDEYGVHIASEIDLCDCLQKNCSGCHFPCSKCKSLKCGPECRVSRKFVYDQLEYQGCDLIVKNPFPK